MEGGVPEPPGVGGWVTGLGSSWGWSFLTHTVGTLAQVHPLGAPLWAQHCLFPWGAPWAPPHPGPCMVFQIPELSVLLAGWPRGCAPGPTSRCQPEAVPAPPEWGPHSSSAGPGPGGRVLPGGRGCCLARLSLPLGLQAGLPRTKAELCLTLGPLAAPARRSLHLAAAPAGLCGRHLYSPDQADPRKPCQPGQHSSTSHRPGARPPVLRYVNHGSFPAASTRPGQWPASRLCPWAPPSVRPLGAITPGSRLSGPGPPCLHPHPVSGNLCHCPSTVPGQERVALLSLCGQASLTPGP